MVLLVFTLPLSLHKRMELENVSHALVSSLHFTIRGTINSMKAITLLNDQDEIRHDLTLWWFMQCISEKAAFSSHGDECYGADEDGNLYKGVTALRIYLLRRKCIKLCQCNIHLSFLAMCSSAPVSSFMLGIFGDNNTVFLYICSFICTLTCVCNKLRS